MRHRTVRTGRTTMGATATRSPESPETTETVKIDRTHRPNRLNRRTSSGRAGKNTVVSLVGVLSALAVAGGSAVPASAAGARPAQPSEDGQGVPGSEGVPGSPEARGVPGEIERLASGSSERLRFVVKGSGRASHDGTYWLECDPVRGNHPDARAACAALKRASHGGENPFAPVESRQHCSTIHGGPATARVTGVWKGKRVDAEFNRSGGCEIARWDELVPALPEVK